MAHVFTFKKVSQSYRMAILETAKAFGVEITSEHVTEMKARGNANNDWIVTHRLIQGFFFDFFFNSVRFSSFLFFLFFLFFPFFIENIQGQEPPSFEAVKEQFESQ